MVTTALAPIKRKWIGRKAQEYKWMEIAEKFHIHPLVARILVARDIYNELHVEEHLRTDRTGIYSPNLLHDIDKTVQRIRQAVERNERIHIVGDYDVDGTCATAILVKVLRAIGANPTYHIPSRFTEGYGLSIDVVEECARTGVHLLITVDTGITAIEQALRVKELGVSDLIVTDHHHFANELPKTFATVHPRYPRSYYPEKNLCGAGVAFKIAQALLERVPDELFDLVALATVSDQVPLLDENRVLVREGLRQMNHNPSLGVQALLAVTGLDKQRVTSTHIAFQLGPRINSMGRLKHAKRVVEMFLTDDPDEAYAIAEELNDLNQFRKSIQERMEQEALEQIEANPHWLEKKTLTVFGADFNEGLVGIVAGRLAERFHKPTLCLAKNGDMAKGSGRSIRGYDLHRSLAEDVQGKYGLFYAFGGHEAAAGFSLELKDVEKLREAFWDAGDEAWNKEIPEANYTADAPLELKDLNITLVDELKRLEPYGQQNPEPIFFVPYAKVWDVNTMGAGHEHLRITLEDEIGRLHTIVAFGRGQDLRQWERNSVHRLLVTVQENVRNGQRRVQLQLVDVRKLS